VDEASTAGAAWLGATGVVLVAFYWSAFRRSSARTPSGIVDRLSRTGHPISLRAGSYRAWDPSAARLGYFREQGTAVYALDDHAIVHVRLTTKANEVIERSGPIPAYMHPNTSVTLRRRRIARAVITLYLAVAVVTFSVTAHVLEGSRSYRARTACLVALAALSGAWLMTHLVLALRSDRSGSTGPSPVRWLRRVCEWSLAYVVLSAVLGVAWRFQGDASSRPSWATAFIEGGIFVLVTAATIAACTHHSNFIHHAPDKDRP
jgi:hypothetical protein